MADEYSIESILADVKRYTGGAEQKSWSLEDVDALLGDTVSKPQEEPVQETPKVQLAEPKEQPIVSEIEEQKAEPKRPTPEKAEVPKPAFSLKEIAMQNAFETAEAPEEILPETPLMEGTIPAFDPEEEEPTLEEMIAVDKEQLTIEKTRIFNEVNPHAERDDRIEHHIGNKITHTIPVDQRVPKGKGMETDKYRERFLNEPKLQMEKTMEHKKALASRPPKTIEKFGVVVHKNNMEKTSEDGLMPPPTIVSAEDELRAWQEKEPESSFSNEDANDDMGQIRLDGFEMETPPEKIDEYETEMDLIEKRRERAKNFRLFPNLPQEETAEEEPLADEKTQYVPEMQTEQEEETAKDAIRQKESVPDEEEELRIAREYYSYKDAQAVYDTLLSDRKKASCKVIVFSVMLLILILGTATVAFTGNFGFFGGSVYTFLGMNVFCLLLSAIFEGHEIHEAFENIQNKKVTRSAAVTVALLFGLLQSIMAFGFPEEVGKGSHIYAPLAIFLFLLIALGDWIKIKTDIRNFEHVTENAKSLYSVSKVENEDDAFEIGRGLLLGDPDIRYNSKIAFPTGFVEHTKRTVPENKIFKTVLPVTMIASILVGIVTAVLTKSIFAGMTALSGVIFLGMPISAVLSAADILKTANKTLNREGALISGYKAVEDAMKTNAVAADASDLFLSNGCQLFGFKLFHSMRVDDAILYTAAVIIESGGTLSNVFDGIILSKREILPPVESLNYEEKLGCSGWIHNQRVLVGNRDLLSKHNVEVPSEESERKYCKDGRQILYLAVEGKTAAMFVVGYTANAETAKYLRKLEKDGISVLIRTSDPNITEKLVEQYFDLPNNFVKIINPVAGKILKKLCDTEKPKDPCRIIHNGHITSMLHAFTSAFSLQEQLRISSILQYIGIGIGILLEAMLSFSAGFSQAGVPQILLFQILWILLVVFVPKLKKI